METEAGKTATPLEQGEGARQALSAEFWELIIDAIPEGISVHDTNGLILCVNRTLSEIYQKGESELVGTSCEQAFHTPESTCNHSLVVESGHGLVDDSKSKINDRTYSISINPIKDAGGRTTGYVRLMRDITDRLRSQGELLKAERFATLGQMISGIAHDVGTPLNIISGYCEYLLMRAKPDSQGYKELSTILQQTRRIAEFIKQMLDLARPAQGRSDAIELKGFLADSLDLMGHHFRKADIKAGLTSMVNPPLIYGDAPRLRQALFNLLLNALQKIGGGGRLEITLGGSADKPGMILVVISASARGGEHVDFSKFFSGFLNPSRAEGDTGMGLSLAREILDEFGAEVDSQEVDDLGSPLLLYLPMKGTAAIARP